MIGTALVGHILQFVGVVITAWVAWRVHKAHNIMVEVAHQTNSMQHEMQRLAKAEGKAEAEEEQREEVEHG